MVRVFSFYDDAYCGAHFLEKQRQLHASRCRSHREENLRWLDAVPCSGRMPWWSMPPPGVCLLKWTTFRTRIPKVGHDATCSEAQVLVATADRVINPEIAHCHRTPERTYNWKVFLFAWPLHTKPMQHVLLSNGILWDLVIAAVSTRPRKCLPRSTLLDCWSRPLYKITFSFSLHISVRTE